VRLRVWWFFLRSTSV